MSQRNLPFPKEDPEFMPLTLKSLARVSEQILEEEFHGESASRVVKTEMINDNLEPFMKPTTTMFSPSSSVYSSADDTKLNGREYHFDNSTNETLSARSCGVASCSQDSARSKSSSVGSTSASNNSRSSEPDQPRQFGCNKKRSRRQALRQALNFSSLRKNGTNVEIYPSKWLGLRSNASSKSFLSEQKAKLEAQSREIAEDKEERVEDSCESKRHFISPDLGLAIMQKIGKLERKIDCISSHAMLVTRDTAYGHSEGKQGIDELNDITQDKAQSDSVRANLGNESQIDTDHAADKANQIQLGVLTAEVCHLAKSNNKLSSCIDALGSSGLIDLLECLSLSLKQLHSAVSSLGHQQKQQQDLISEQISKILRHESEKHEDRMQKDIGLLQQQIESQSEIIQRLAFVLGKREEQLKLERNVSQRCLKDIDALSEMISALEVECNSSDALTMPSQDERMGDCVNNLLKWSKRASK